MANNKNGVWVYNTANSAVRGNIGRGAGLTTESDANVYGGIYLATDTSVQVSDNDADYLGVYKTADSVVRGNVAHGTSVETRTGSSSSSSSDHGNILVTSDSGVVVSDNEVHDYMTVSYTMNSVVRGNRANGTSAEDYGWRREGQCSQVDCVQSTHRRVDCKSVKSTALRRSSRRS